MSWVIQQPHSQTNADDFFQVVEFSHWREFCDGERKSIPVVAKFESYAEARGFITEEESPELQD
jgi:hypothetical protein